MEAPNSQGNRLHRQIDQQYMEAIAELAIADEYVGEKNYLKALESLDYALDSLGVMRTLLQRVSQRPKA